MDSSVKLPGQLPFPAALAELLAETAAIFAKDQRRAFRVARRTRKGRTLRPSPDTPLWNALAAEVKPHLRTHGTQANLARLLGLDRQAINAYFVAKTRMPDAERTLQLLVWLIATRQGSPPS